MLLNKGRSSLTHGKVNLFCQGACSLDIDTTYSFLDNYKGVGEERRKIPFLEKKHHLFEVVRMREQPK